MKQTRLHFCYAGWVRVIHFTAGYSHSLHNMWLHPLLLHTPQNSACIWGWGADQSYHPIAEVRDTCCVSKLFFPSPLDLWGWRSHPHSFINSSHQSYVLSWWHSIHSCSVLKTSTRYRWIFHSNLARLSATLAGKYLDQNTNNNNKKRQNCVLVSLGAAMFLAAACITVWNSQRLQGDFM